MKRIDDPGTTFEQANHYVVEAYFHGDGKLLGWTDGKSGPYGETVEELRQTLTRMLEALDKPVLDEAILLAEAEAARENGDEEIFPSERLSLDEVLEALGLDRGDIDDS